MNSRNAITAIESELTAERDAIQEEGCTATELQQLRALRRRRGNAWKRWAVPANAKPYKCKDCGEPIWWRSEFGVAFPLDCGSMEIEAGVGQTAVCHWRICGQPTKTPGA